MHGEPPSPPLPSVALVHSDYRHRHSLIIIIIIRPMYQTIIKERFTDKYRPAACTLLFFYQFLKTLSLQLYRCTLYCIQPIRMFNSRIHPNPCKVRDLMVCPFQVLMSKVGYRPMTTRQSQDQ